MTIAQQGTLVHVITRPEAAEVDLLVGNESSDFIVKDLGNSEQLRHPAPVDGWTHDALEALMVPNEVWDDGCDFYLNQIWVGSSEI